MLVCAWQVYYLKVRPVLVSRSRPSLPARPSFPFRLSPRPTACLPILSPLSTPGIFRSQARNLVGSESWSLTPSFRFCYRQGDGTGEMGMLLWLRGLRNATSHMGAEQSKGRQSERRGRKRGSVRASREMTQRGQSTSGSKERTREREGTKARDTVGRGRQGPVEKKTKPKTKQDKPNRTEASSFLDPDLPLCPPRQAIDPPQLPEQSFDLLVGVAFRNKLLVVLVLLPTRRQMQPKQPRNKSGEGEPGSVVKGSGKGAEERGGFCDR